MVADMSTRPTASLLAVASAQTEVTVIVAAQQ